MPKTVNSYTPDGGEIQITISAADVTAITAFTTAEDINIDGVVRKLEESTPKTRQYSETYVTGSNAPILSMSDKEAISVWTLTIVDDYTSGAAGEWGTDNLAALEILQEFFDAKRPITVLKASPAGSDTGMIQTSLTNVEIQNMPHANIDSDSTSVNEVVISLIVESYTKAAHA
jgi:hypothetical protein